MLVISRRPEETFTFPKLGVTVRLLQVRNNTVRLGIDAPPHLAVLRGELVGREPAEPAAPDPAHHALCNRLSKVTLSLHLLERQWEVGQHDAARQTLARVLDQLEAMDRDWVAAQLPAPAPSFKALVVEDDSNERELLAGLLALKGCQCATAADGEGALAALEANGRPDFVLLDMWMPNCDGPQTLRRIRTDRRYDGVKVFSISSTRPEEVGLSTGPGGLDAWFPKPLNPRKLWDAMAGTLRGQAGRN